MTQPAEWQGGGTDLRRNPGRVKELERQLAMVKAALNVATQALATEREVGHNQAVTLGQHIARLEDELAAERIESKQRQTLWANEVGILHQQLAAERHKREACEVLIRDLQKELAAMAL